jgi:hypothetical protein
VVVIMFECHQPVHGASAAITLCASRALESRFSNGTPNEGNLWGVFDHTLMPSTTFLSKGMKLATLNVSKINAEGKGRMIMDQKL